MAKVLVPDIPGPRQQLCWKSGPLMDRCDRRKGHGGPHTWEMAAANKRLRTALTDLCDAIPDDTAKADPPLEVWIEQARSVLEGRPYRPLVAALEADHE